MTLDLDVLEQLVPRLEDAGHDVVLRAHRPQDVARMVELANDPTTRRWIDLPTPYDIPQAEDFLGVIRSGWEQGDRGSWAIEVGGRFAGTVDYRRLPGARAEVGYSLHPDARGAGAAAAAVRLVVEHAFATGVEHLAWRAAEGNLASWRVAWRLGFRRDGVWRAQHLSSDGHVDDLWVGSLHRDEPRRPRLPWWEPAVLTGDRVRLRPWRDDDVPRVQPDAVAELYNEGMQPPPEKFASWLLARRCRMAVGQGVFWCIADATDDEPLGHLQVQHLDRDFTRGSGLLGYWLYPRARGRGVISDALDLVVPHAFTRRTDDAGRSGLGLHRLQAGTDAGNRASQRALRRAGFREVGTERAVLAHDDRPPTDALSFELLAGDDRVAQVVEPFALEELSTDRLVLRAWRPSDAPPEGVLPDAQLLRFSPVATQPTAATFPSWLAAVQRVLDRATGLCWCIADRATDRPLGSIGLSAPASVNVQRRMEVGYWLYADARGHGYAAEALAAVLRHALAPVDEDGLGLARVCALVDPENEVSVHLLRSARFDRTGHDHPLLVRASGSAADMDHYELTATDGSS